MQKDQVSETVEHILSMKKVTVSGCLHETWDKISFCDEKILFT